MRPSITASFHHLYNGLSLLGLFASFALSTRFAVLLHLKNQLALPFYRAVPPEEFSEPKISSSVASRWLSKLALSKLRTLVVRQLLVHNRKIPESEMADKIDAVTPESSQRVALRVFGPQSGGNFTVLAMGKHDLGD